MKIIHYSEAEPKHFESDTVLFLFPAMKSIRSETPVKISWSLPV
jgi:hypothetical protein